MNFAPPTHPDELQHRRMIAEAANSALRAETHNLGVATVAAGASSLTIVDSRIGRGKYVFLVPRNAASAACPWYMDSVSDGSAVFKFTSPPSATASFGYVIVGVGGGQD